MKRLKDKTIKPRKSLERRSKKKKKKDKVWAKDERNRELILDVQKEIKRNFLNDKLTEIIIGGNNKK